MNKTQIGLIVSICVIGILIISIQWDYRVSQEYMINHSYLNSEFDDLTSTYHNYVTDHTHANSEYESLESEFDDLTSTYHNYVTDHTHANSEYESLKSERDTLKSQVDPMQATISTLQNQVDEYDAIVSLEKNQIIISQYTINQGAYSRHVLKVFECEYAGYLEISMTSTTDNAYVIVEYWYEGILYSEGRTLGYSGSVNIPILPASIAVYVGNTNWFNGATHTMSIVYHY